MNKPVGVVCEFEGILVGTLFEQLPDGTSLYTHPVKEKGLPRSSPSPMNQACLTRSDNYSPVLWVNHLCLTDISTEETIIHNVPLFTHPVKELTDEEITDIGYKFGEMGLNIQMIRAILRKANEK